MSFGKLGALGAGFSRMGAGGGASAPAFSISDIFGNGTYAGFDFTDLERTKVWGPSSLPLLYGTNVSAQISASAQAVGFSLDKSQGLVLGAEKVTNGDFPANITGWTAIRGATAAWDTGRLKVTHGSTSFSGANQAIGSGLTSGKWYRGSCDLIADAGAPAKILITNSDASSVYVTVPAISAGTTQAVVFYFQATPTIVSAGYVTVQHDTSNTTPGFVLYADNITIKEVPGNHAQQGTSSARPAYTESGALRYLSFDGSDDNLLTSLAVEGSFTLGICARPTAAGGHFMSSVDAGVAQRCYFQTNASGLASISYGGSAPAVIGASDLRNTDHVLLFRGSPTRVDLTVDGVLIGSATPSGTSVSGAPLLLGGLNIAGSPAGFFTGRIYRAVAVQRYLPDNMVVPLMQALGAGVVSF